MVKESEPVRERPHTQLAENGLEPKVSLFGEATRTLPKAERSLIYRREQLEKSEWLREVERSVGRESSSASRGPAASVDAVDKAFAKRPVLTQCRLDVEEGMAVGLLGANGANKLLDEWATVALASRDAETRFRALAARGNPMRGLRLWDEIASRERRGCAR